MKRYIKSVFIFFIIIFLIMGSYLVYFQIRHGEKLANDPRNRRVSQREASAIRGRIFDRNGKLLAETTEENQRYYIDGPLFAHIIGYNHPIYGKSGLESTFNRELSGFYQRSFLETVLRAFSTKPIHGYDLVLTLDARLQKVAYEALGNRPGAVLAIDPLNGDILVAVSRPSFDPNELQMNWDTITNDEDAPLLNRATQGLYPPGSAIKPLVAAAALDSKSISKEDTFFCRGETLIGGYSICCDREEAHGKLNLKQAMAVSCNTTFAHIGSSLGSKIFYKYIQDFLFTQAIKLEVSTSAGRFPISAHELADIVENSIGQGKAMVTPLHMALMVATIANGGILLEPRLVSVVKTREGRRISYNKESILAKPISSLVAQEVTSMMVEVVNSGTAKRAMIEGINVAGKTGTADNPGGQGHAWFIGFAPVERPTIAVAVIVENGGYGGTVAAPIGKEIMSQALKP